MDPNTALKDILDHLYADDRENAADSLRDLASWLEEKHGMFPDTFSVVEEWVEENRIR